MLSQVSIERLQVRQRSDAEFELSMIRNGLYSINGKLLDDAKGSDNGVMMLRDGGLRGGNSFFYFYGSYSCSSGKWRGEIISQEHTLAFATRPFARKLVSVGFTGTYDDETAEFNAAVLLGKRSVQMAATLRLLLAD
jgi:hypothetical protein